MEEEPSRLLGAGQELPAPGEEGGPHPGGTRPLAALPAPPSPEAPLPSIFTPFISGADPCTSSMPFICSAALGHPSASLSLGLPSSITWGIHTTSLKRCGYQATAAWCGGGQPAYDGGSLSFSFLVKWEQSDTHLKTSLVVWWLRLHTSNAGGMSSIPGQGTKIPYAT